MRPGRGAYRASQNRYYNNKQNYGNSTNQNQGNMTNNMNTNQGERLDQQNTYPKEEIIPKTEIDLNKTIEVPTIPYESQQSQQQPICDANDKQFQNLDTKNSEEERDGSQEEGDEMSKTLPWKKGKLNKIKKLSNSEKRGRQNKKLRKLITPKTALMVLNELHGPNVPEYKLGQTIAQPYTGTSLYKAEVVVNGSTYQGQGPSKIVAKNNAAEKAIRDLVLERMRNELIKQTLEGDDVVMEDPSNPKKEKESQVPMLHLASYALHKLFSEWQADGYEIPLLTKNLSASTTNLADIKVDGPEQVAAKKLPKMKNELPANAANMHPTMLLAQMRPGCQYNEISVDGTGPSNSIFTIGVVVDGQQFTGSARNKKEARRQAAMEACKTIFGLVYPIPEVKPEGVPVPIA